MNRIVWTRADGGGWWTVVLNCGHRAKVLTGREDPLHQDCDCLHCTKQQKDDALLDRMAAMLATEPLAVLDTGETPT